jgi:hypothetical protein
MDSKRKNINLKEAFDFCKQFRPDTKRMMKQVVYKDRDFLGRTVTYGPVWQHFKAHEETKKDEIEDSEKITPDPYYITRYHRKHYYCNLQHAIDGNLMMGFYFSPLSRVLGLDIDFHDPNNPAWTKQTRNPTDQLFKTYRAILKYCTEIPSLTVESPHGLHLYWLFELPILFDLPDLIYYMKERLPPKANIEILPTTNKPLRVPQKKYILNPYDLTRALPRKKDRTFDFNGLKRYKSLFDVFPKYPPHEIYTPEEPSDDYPAVTYDHVEVDDAAGSHLEAAEAPAFDRRVFANHPPEKPETRSKTTSTSIDSFLFTTGNTYNEFPALYKKCRDKGMGLPEIKDVFYETLDRSQQYGYSGPLHRNHRTVDKRIEFLHDTYLPLKTKVTSSTFKEIDQDLIETLYRQLPPINQRPATVKKFLYRLIQWYETTKESLNNFDYHSSFIAGHPNASMKIKEGYLPLPSTLLKSWVTRYHEILQVLLSTGILQVYNKGQYSQARHLCRYYKLRNRILW